MKGLFFAAIVLLFAKPPAKPGAGVPPKPGAALAPLPMSPSVGRVKLSIQAGALVVVEDVTLPRGTWEHDSLDFHVAFGAPGVPRAFDAHLLPLGDGELEAADDARGESMTFDRVPRRPPTAHGLFGREHMAGVVVHLTHDALASAFEPAKMAVLRLRTAYELPELDPQGARSVVVRLGALPLGRLVIGSKVAKAEAKLCGTDEPLAIGHVTKGVAPILAQRHASDDLCIRLW